MSTCHNRTQTRALSMMARVRRRQNAILFIVAVSLALYMPPVMNFLPYDGFNNDPSSTRLLRRLQDVGSIPNDVDIENAHQLALPPPAGSLPAYSLENVLQAIDIYHDNFAVVVYDPEEDKFIAFYSEKHRWVSGCAKLLNSFKILANSLRLMYPNRFKSGTSSEFAIAMSSGDYPGVNRLKCIRQGNFPCASEEIAPILHFGSVFKDRVIPSMIAMPMPQNNHLACYHKWAQHGVLCDYYLPRSLSNSNGFVYGDTIGLKWDDLIPQVVWRGTDFSYLHKVEPDLRQPDFDSDLGHIMSLSSGIGNATAAVQSMREKYDSLIPRWKGVVWTAEAELEAKQSTVVGSIPWANIKFASCMDKGQKKFTGDVEYYQEFEGMGIPAIGKGMSLEELGKYKYHIDIGGGGGTTWSGTMEKLGLPGLLFHHVTPTKDYFHDKMIPWVHYIPIREDLMDLKRKFEWAEAHQGLAKRISERATMLSRSLGTPDGFQEMYDEFYEHPLKKSVEAYQPLATESWSSVMERIAGESLTPVMKCGGYFHHDCEGLVDEATGYKRYDIKQN